MSSPQNRKHRPTTDVREVGFRLILPLVTLLWVFLLFCNKLLREAKGSGAKAPTFSASSTSTLPRCPRFSKSQMQTSTGCIHKHRRGRQMLSWLSGMQSVQDMSTSSRVPTVPI